MLSERFCEHSTSFVKYLEKYVSVISCLQNWNFPSVIWPWVALHFVPSGPQLLRPSQETIVLVYVQMWNAVEILCMEMCYKQDSFRGKTGKSTCPHLSPLATLQCRLCVCLCQPAGLPKAHGPAPALESRVSTHWLHGCRWRCWGRNITKRK